MSVFAWKPADMPGVPRNLIEHSLKISKTARPIKQKLRRFARDKKEAIRIETTWLLAAGFIKEVYHPDWLANPVLVRKKNNEWRMYVDYTDLNKHCPKDPFGPPCIDEVVHSTTGCELLSFLDCYSGYHQISLKSPMLYPCSLPTSCTPASCLHSITASCHRLPPHLQLLYTQFEAFYAVEMVKSDSKKRAEMMAKEWKKSWSTTWSLNYLVEMGLLHDQELGGWRAPEGESYPDPRAGEVVVFEDFFKRGFGVPVHPFLQGLLLYYEIGICNLHPNSILLVATFIHLCEAFVGIEPHFDLFCYLICLRKKGAIGSSKIAGGVHLNFRDGMKNRYLSCPWNTSLTEWYNRWFYIREEPGSTMLCDVGYIPEKKTSWTDRPEYTGQVSELTTLIDWSRLDGLGVVGNFLSKRVMP